MTHTSKLAKGKRLLNRTLEPKSCESAEALRITEYGVRSALGSLGCSKSAVDCMIKESFGMNDGSSNGSIRDSIDSEATLTGQPNSLVPMSREQKRHSILLNRELSNPERFKDLLVHFDEKALPGEKETSQRRSSAISERLPTPHPSHSDLEETGSCDTVGSYKDSLKSLGKSSKVTEDVNEEQASPEKLEQIASGNSKISLMSEVLRGKAGKAGRRATPAFAKSEKKRLFGEFGDEKNKYAMMAFGEGEEDEEEEDEGEEDEGEEDRSFMERASEECTGSEMTDDLASSEIERASMAHRMSGCSDMEGSVYGRSQRRSSIGLACSSLSINNPPRKPIPPEPRRESAASSQRFESRESSQSRFRSRTTFSNISINNPPSLPVSERRRESSVESPCVEGQELLKGRRQSDARDLGGNMSKEGVLTTDPERNLPTRRESSSRMMSDKLRRASLDKKCSSSLLLRNSSSKQIDDDTNGIRTSTPTVNIDSGTNLESESSNQKLPGMRPSRSRMTCNIDPSVYSVASGGGNGSPSLNSQELIGTVDDNEKENIVSIDVRDELEKDQRSERGLNVKEEASEIGASDDTDEFARLLTESLSRFKDDKEQEESDEIKESVRESTKKGNDSGRESFLEEFVVVHENELASIQDVNAGALATDVDDPSTEVKGMYGGPEKVPSVDSDSSRLDSRGELTRGKSKISGINIAVRKNRRKVSIDQPNFDSPREAGERQVRRTSRSGLLLSSDANSGDAVVSSRSRRFSIEEDTDSLKGASLRSALSMVEGSEAGSDDVVAARSSTFSAAVPNDSFSGSKIYVTPVSPSMDFTTSVRDKTSGPEQ